MNNTMEISQGPKAVKVMHLVPMSTNKTRKKHIEYTNNI